jgi:lipid-binding SYLF domain-containing protein
MEIFMERSRIKSKLCIAAMTACMFGLASLGNAQAKGWEAKDMALNDAVNATLVQCQKISTSCAGATQTAVGVLVFPSVTKADLIIGGAGGKGALVEHGKITGYYNIGALSAGLQAGIENTSHVYAFQTPAALAELKEGQEWKVSSNAGATLVSADANARGTTGKDVLAYVFDSKGLHAGVSLDVFDVWKTGQPRPGSHT